MMPEATSAAPRMSVSHTAVSSGLSNADEARNDVEDAEQKPEDEASPGLDLERVDDLENAGDDHHDADDVDRRHGRHDDAAKRDDASDEVDDAEGDDPAPFAPERRDARAGPEP